MMKTETMREHIKNDESALNAQCTFIVYLSPPIIALHMLWRASGLRVSSV